jgi:hypothetical protein
LEEAAGFPARRYISFTDIKVLKEGATMNKYKGFSKMWFLVLLLVAVVAGCASNPDETVGTAGPVGPVGPVGTTRPTVKSTVPATTTPIQTVLPDTAVTVTFDKDMASGSITAAGAFTVTYDAASRTATFHPAAALAPGTYIATIKGTGPSAVTDSATSANALAGNPSLPLEANDYVWSFTTSNTIVPPNASQLGSAATYGIMATLAITNTGAATRINGDVSLDPGTSNGLLPSQVNGTIHINDAESAKAKADLLTAYNHYTNLPPGITVPAGMDLGAFGVTPGTLPPGTYTSGSTMLVSTPLTLKGSSTDVWVFQIGSSLTTTANVILGPGVQANNVFWVPALDATIGVNSNFSGTIVAGRDATAKTGAVINGRILAGATNPGTIALDTNIVNVP